jgi:ATP adenylyltransferase
MFSSWLYAPNRMDWVKNPEKRPKGCVFCKIGKDSKPQQHFILHKTARFFVVMNIFPYNTGHLMVVPLRHVKDMDELSDDEVSEMFLVVRKCTRLLRKVLNPVGFNIGLNEGGSCSGASMEHLHVHIVPRYKTDFGFMDIIGGTKVLPEELSGTYRRLMKEVGMLG